MRCMVRRLRGTRSSIDYRGVYSADRITFIVVRHDGLDFFALQLVKLTVERVRHAERRGQAALRAPRAHFTSRSNSPTHQA